MTAPDYFIPQRDPRAFYPLRDFVRAPSISVAREYIKALTAPGDLIVDPFGAMPNVAYAAHALGRRALVIDSNPLWAWLARAMTTLPPASEINAALTKLGDALKDDAPLRTHITQLYATTCAACDKSTPADYFTRVRDGGILKRHYTCAHCGATRTDNATEDDRKRAQTFDAHGLHYHLAFERVAPEDQLHADRIEKMLDLYTPRNLYALVTLTQKIDSLFRVPRERNILLVLFLHLLDRGTSFYAAPDSFAQLKAHPQFIEFNLWREIEIAARALAENQPLPLTETLAEVIAADAPRAFVGRGNAATLAREIPRQSIALVLATQPTRRVGLLALAYFWGAWILGRAAAQSLETFLDAKKDFVWELRYAAELLDNTLKTIEPLLRADARVVFTFNESRHRAIEGLLMASAAARLELEAFLFQPRVDNSARSEFGDLRGSYRIAFRKNETPAERQANGERELPSDDARALWRTASPAPSPVNVARLEEMIRAAALDAGREILARRGQASAFTWVHHAAYARIAREGLLVQAIEAKLKLPPGRFVHQAVIEGLSAGYAEDFDHYATPTQFVWLRRAPSDAPLIDRVDDAVREWLARPDRFQKPVRSEELQDAIYRQFPGDLTPEAGLVELCAAAFNAAAEAERARAMELLKQLGERLGFQVIASRAFATLSVNSAVKQHLHRTAFGAVQVSPSNLEIASSSFDSAPLRSGLFATTFDLAWLDAGELVHGFIWRDRAQFADLPNIQIAPACGYLIVPENVVALMQEKVRRLPHLADAFHEASWSFVRVPSVARLLESEKIERHDLAFMTGLEPQSFDKGTQLELFDDTT